MSLVPLKNEIKLEQLVKYTLKLNTRSAIAMRSQTQSMMTNTSLKITLDIIFSSDFTISDFCESEALCISVPVVVWRI